MTELTDYEDESTAADVQDAEVDLDSLRRLLLDQRIRVTFSAATPSLDYINAKPEVRQVIQQALETGAPLYLRRANDVPMHSLLKFASALCFTLSAGSLALWLQDFAYLIGPFPSLLGLVACPFLYWMGEAARISPAK